ncbi:MAG TPA: histidine kinase, partial [Thermoleophilia bacterium]|nr:histidine kinase [Thermoleophilia bacterium]
ALVFSGRARWIWTGSLVVLIGASLMVALGPFRGLGLAMTTMAVAIAFPALAVASREIELARADSQKMVADLEATHQRLEEYAAQADELAVMEERNRLARELLDSVSQAMFSILLATRSAQIMQQKDPDGVPAQLEQLQALTQEALVRMRGFIAELRPKTG